MSHSIYILDPSPSVANVPETLEGLWRIIEPELKRSRPVNPRYVALAERVGKRLLADAGSATAPGHWLNSMLQDAEALHLGAWHLELPNSGTYQVLTVIVEEALELELLVLDDHLGFGFLLDGRVLPDSRSLEWELFAEGVSQAPATLSLEQRRAQVRTRIEPLMLSRGFQAAKEYDQGCLAYLRPFQGGWQELWFKIVERYGFFFWEGKFVGVSDAVHELHMKFLDYAEYEIDYHINFSLLIPAIDGSNQPANEEFDTPHQLERVLQELKDRWLPLMDQAMTDQGLFQLIRDSAESPLFKPSFIGVRGFAPLILAYRFDRIKYAEWLEIFERRDITDFGADPGDAKRLNAWREKLRATCAYLQERY